MVAQQGQAHPAVVEWKEGGLTWKDRIKEKKKQENT